MFDLLLAIACSSAIGLVIRWSEGRGLDRNAVTAANYLTALLAGLFLPGAWSGLHTAVRALPGEIPGIPFCFPSASWPVIAGVPAGFLYLAGLVWYQKSVASAGVGLTAGFGKLGVLVPVAASALIWSEVPSGMRLAGMATALLAIAAGAVSTRGGGKVKPSLIIFFFAGGLAEFSNKLFQEYSRAGTEGTFLTVVFGTALVSSLVTAPPGARSRLFRTSVLAGAMLGVPNLLASFFLVRALDGLPAPVVFSAFSAGTIAVLGAAGSLVFGERRTLLEWSSIAAAMVALLLMNLG